VTASQVPPDFNSSGHCLIVFLDFELILEYIILMIMNHCICILQRKARPIIIEFHLLELVKSLFHEKISPLGMKWRVHADICSIFTSNV